METLEIAETLEGIGVEHKKAYSIAETINGKSGLATKEDIAEVRKEIAEIRSELKTDIKWIMGIMITGLGTISAGIIALLIATIK